MQYCIVLAVQSSTNRLFINRSPTPSTSCSGRAGS